MSELVDKDAFLKQERKWYCENCDRRKGVKNGRKCFVYEIGEVPCRACDVDDVLDDLECFETIDASPWHRVEDELPKEKGWYLVYAPTYRGGSSSGKESAGSVMFSKWSGKTWSIEVGYYERPNCVTHWMPLPEPPKEENDGN